MARLTHPNLNSALRATIRVLPAMDNKKGGDANEYN
jgi:hypothetical protein